MKRTIRFRNHLHLTYKQHQYIANKIRRDGADGHYEGVFDLAGLELRVEFAAQWDRIKYVHEYRAEVPSRENPVFMSSYNYCIPRIFSDTPRVGKIDNTQELSHAHLTAMVDALISRNIDYFDAKCIDPRWSPKQAHDYILLAAIGNADYSALEHRVTAHLQASSVGDALNHLTKSFGATAMYAVNTNQPGSYTSIAEGFDSETGEAIVTNVYNSRILNGEQLQVGRVYRLEIVGGNVPPEMAKAGGMFKALGDSDGNFTGDMLDATTSCVFTTNASDLWLVA